jgi:hypothetical protein
MQDVTRDESGVGSRGDAGGGKGKGKGKGKMEDGTIGTMLAATGSGMLSEWPLPEIVVTAAEANGPGAGAADSDDSSTDNHGMADGKRNQHAHEREMDDARRASAAEAARIVITSCLAGDLIQKQNAKRKRRIQAARIGGGSDHGPSRQPKEKKPDGEKERTFNDFMKKIYDPYPILYWECWHGKIPKRLEMHPMGVKWEGDEGEGAPREENEVERETGEDKKKGTLRERAKRRIQSLSLTDRDSGTGWKWWSLRGEGSDKTNKRGSLKGMFGGPSHGDASSGSGSAALAGHDEQAGSGGKSAAERRITDEKAPSIEQDYTIGVGNGRILDAESWWKDIGITDLEDKDAGAVDSCDRVAEESGEPLRRLHRRLSRRFSRSLSRHPVLDNLDKRDVNTLGWKKPAYRVPPNTRVLASQNSSSSSETYYSDATGAPTQPPSAAQPRAASSLGGAGGLGGKSERRSSLARLKGFGQLLMTGSRSHHKDESA